MYYGSNAQVSPKAWANLSLQSQPTYRVITPRVALPLTLEQVREQIKNIAESDSYLTLLINTAADFFERYTNRILINTQFRNYRDFFTQSLELRRSRLQTLDSFTYLVDGAETIVDSSTYYTTDEDDYSRIIFNSFDDMPQDKDDRLQAIIIDFTAGYGVDSTAIPTDIQMGLLQHIAAMEEKRGDCEGGTGTGTGTSGCSATPLPSTAKMIYDSYRIVSLGGVRYRD